MDCFPTDRLSKQTLDGHQAVTVTEEDLPDLNNCINFVDEYAI